MIFDVPPIELKELEDFWDNKKQILKMEQKQVESIVNDALLGSDHIIENQFLIDLVDNFMGFGKKYDREHMLAFGSLLISVREIYNPYLNKDLEIIEAMLAAITKVTEVQF